MVYRTLHDFQRRVVFLRQKYEVSLCLLLKLNLFAHLATLPTRFWRALDVPGSRRHKPTIEPIPREIERVSLTLTGGGEEIRLPDMLRCLNRFEFPASQMPGQLTTVPCQTTRDTVLFLINNDKLPSLIIFNATYSTSSPYLTTTARVSGLRL